MNRFVLCIVVSTCALLGVASPAMASLAPCQFGSVAPVFSPWADPSSYTLVKGAGFESGASGWSWGGGANIVAGDDGNLPASRGSHVVQIPGGGTARSPWACVDMTSPTLRFLVKRVSGSGSLVVKGQISGPSGISLTTFAVMSGSGTWQPSPIVLFPAVFTSLLSPTGLSAQFQFTADAGTTFRIDDVYLDPYKKT
jgi:hypothetical protein